MSTTCVRISQNEAIKTYLEKGNSLTGLEALKKFGCIHLPRRICDLKEKGVNICKKMIKTNTGKRIAEYSLMN